jgi:hypothetical protein
MILSNEQLRALRLLDNAGPRGATVVLLASNGMGVNLLVALVREGLAAAITETVRAGDRPIEVTRVRITGAGRDALKVP